MTGADAAVSRASANYAEYTTKASELLRSLGLAAIAVAWLFSGGIAASGSPQASLDALQTSDSLYWTFRFAVCALAADLLQYAAGAALWGTLHWSLDQVNRNDSAREAGWRGKLAWRILRASNSLKFVERSETSSTALTGAQPKSYVDRRDRIRGALAGRDESIPEAAGVVRTVLAEHVPSWLPGVTVFLWLLKLTFLSASYTALLIYVWRG